MKIVVLADEESFDLLKSFNADADWFRISSAAAFTAHADADAFFDLSANAASDFSIDSEIPLFINSVLLPKHKQANLIRINGWNGFLENESWEVAGEPGEKAKTICNFLKKKIIVAPDESGLISPRIIAMIINEAFYALEDGVSTKPEIDTAMRLGTNYPYGPFEWAEKIGLENIHALLSELFLTDERFKPSAALIKQMKES